jgi:hypothetical protein
VEAGRPWRLDVPPDWAAALNRIAAGGVRRVLVLGPADAGKSTFCRVLLRRAARNGLGVRCWTPTDPAQKLVGPPACVTLGRGEASALSALAFAGALDPLRGWRRLMAGVGQLAAEAAGADLLVANTSGLLAGAGRRLKAAEIAAARPDLLVALGEGVDLDAVLADHEAIAAFRLARSPLARRRGRGSGGRFGARPSAANSQRRRFGRWASTGCCSKASRAAAKPCLRRGASSRWRTRRGATSRLEWCSAGASRRRAVSFCARPGRRRPSPACDGEPCASTRTVPSVCRVSTPGAEPEAAVSVRPYL